MPGGYYTLKSVIPQCNILITPELPLQNLCHILYKALSRVFWKNILWALFLTLLLCFAKQKLHL